MHIDDQAREILRVFYRRATRPAQAASPPLQASTTPTNDVITAVPQATTRASRPDPTTNIRPDGTTKTEKIASIAAQAATFEAPRALGSLRDTLVFSTGTPEADIMLVGEAPGYHEEQQQEPFVGPAGQKLDAILKAMGISRSDVYISNIVKYRPSLPNQTTNNRKPTHEEITTSLPILKAEIDVVAPKVIIALGSTAAQGLLSTNDSVGKLRGKIHKIDGTPLIVTYHPSYLLHNEATSEKRKVWEDMLAVMDHLSMPISAKQRGYFAKKNTT